MRGTGLPPPDRHSNVTIESSLNGPMRDTFLIAAEVLPSSKRISTYSGAATLHTHYNKIGYGSISDLIIFRLPALLEANNSIGFCTEIVSSAISLSCFLMLQPIYTGSWEQRRKMEKSGNNTSALKKNNRENNAPIL